MTVTEIFTSHPFGFVELPREGQGGVEEYNFDEGSFSAPRIFRGPWADRQKFIKEMLPSISQTEDGYLISQAGAAYPDNPIARAYKATVKGKLVAGADGEDQQISYEKAEVTIYYRTATYGSGDVPTGGENPELPNPEILIEEFDTSYEILDIPARSFTSGTGEVFTTPPSRKVIPIINYKITQTHVPKPNFKAMRDLLGHVNSTYFFFPDGDVYGLKYATANGEPATGSNPEVPTFDAEKASHIRYDGPSGVRQYNLFNKVAWRITHSFAMNIIGWNKYLNPDTGIFEDITLRDGSPLYTLGDLNPVLYNESPVPPPPPTT